MKYTRSIRLGWRLVTLCIALSVMERCSQAQLAITEVMSSATTSLGTNVVIQGPDFWELTNLGTNTVDLTGFRFSDSAGLSDTHAGEDSVMFGGRTIAARESIIFVQEAPRGYTNAAQFRALWGEQNLRTNLQIYFYTRRGFSSSNDAVQVWSVTGASTTLVDRVTLNEARTGYTFTYDRATGFLEALSVPGVDGAFKAVGSDDVGSPGVATDPVALSVAAQPRSLAVDAGAPAIFSVRALGLPRPRYQWRLNGIDIAGATADKLEIPATQPADGGSYSVLLANGLTNVTSEAATLEVNTTPSSARIVMPPGEAEVTIGQTAIFQVEARGYPLPTFRWQFKGMDIAGATTARLAVPNANFESAGNYSVHVANALGSTTAVAVLKVRREPNLVITEMMGSRSTNSTISGRGDWWELTNFDTEPVNLRGYRFDDYPAQLDGAVVITNDVILTPGETLLFIKDMTPEFFTRWWGEENLPADVQFITYSGNGISAIYDSITLWNGTALDVYDSITRAEYVHLSPEDGTPIRGRSLNFWCDGPLEFGAPSESGQCGAIRAALSDDIASPGYVVNHPPRPRAVRIARDAGGVHLTWVTHAGSRYELLSKDSLDDEDWTSLGVHTSAGTELKITDPASGVAPRRFYRLQLLP